MPQPGFGPDDVLTARRAVFDVAVEQASARVDHRQDHQAWVEALWDELSGLFGWSASDGPPVES